VLEGTVVGLKEFVYTFAEKRRRVQVVDKCFEFAAIKPSK
jgi:hypothetical protein